MEMNTSFDRTRRFISLMGDIARHRGCRLDVKQLDLDNVHFTFEHPKYDNYSIVVRLSEYADLTIVTTNVWAKYFDERQKKIIPDGVAGIKLDIQCTNMVEKIRQLDVNRLSVTHRANKAHSLPDITDVIFNDPATIVFWSDKTKTVVKCQEGDEFDAEKGLAMAIIKKLYGNEGNYYNQIKKWTELIITR